MGAESFSSATPWSDSASSSRKVGITDGKTGSVTFVQRFGLHLNLNVHFHAIMPDAVFSLGEDQQLIAHQGPSPEDADILAIALRVARRITKALAAPFFEEGPGNDDPDPYEKTLSEAVQTYFPFVPSEEEDATHSFLVEKPGQPIALQKDLS